MRRSDSIDFYDALHQMIDDKHAVPLSPPTSPHMSDTEAKLNDFTWQHAQDALLEPVVLLQEPHIQHEQPLELQLGLEQNRSDHPVEVAAPQARPQLRSHKSFPYSLGPSSRANDAVYQDATSTGGMAEFKEQVVSQGPQPTGNSALPQPSYGGSAPTSPVGRLTPNSPNRDVREGQVEDDDMDLDAGDLDEDEEAGRPPKTAAELRAQKRKMKRFRLTHNQTRFLMSEFARQAHPDAAHRDRLSREIPGLSPRQVQVWFQNRRAKLKRLTTDDRESMMRSRALPAGFDMTQALHAPYGAPTPTGSTPPVSLQSFAPYGGTTGPAALTLDTMRRSSVYQPYAQSFSSPTGITPAIGGFAFTPPQSATETTSPASAIGGSNAFNFQSIDSPRRTHYGPPAGAQPGYVSHLAQVPRIQTHERFNRTVSETVGSPLRTSMSYSGLNPGSASQSHGERSNSFSEQSSYTHERTRQSRSNTTASVGGTGPYGLGFSYSQMPNNYQSPPQPTHSQPQTTPTSHLPATLDAYRRTSPQTTAAPVTYANYTQQAYNTTPQMPQYSYYNSIYGSQPSYGNYQPQLSEQQGHRPQLPQGSIPHPQQAFTPIVTGSQQFGAMMAPAVQPQDPGDNSDGGVPIGSTF